MTARINRHLVVFAKAPVAGRVKQRLAREIGEGLSLRFYRRTTAELLRRLGHDPRWRKWLAVTPDRTARTGGLWPPPWRLVPQGNGDLGARMGRALLRLPPGPVVIVGSDIPDITAAHIAAAFDLLDRCEVVFGPARDGGYWLIGARRTSPLPDLFRNVRWSSPWALSDTLANIGEGRKVGYVEELEDVDDAVAYYRWRRKSST
jgi:rSAM/selenodomain-associated transferase 1